MSNRESKPKRTSEELVSMMRDEKGIRFERMPEAEAVRYLKDRNNYLRTAAYRKNYDKHTTGECKGKYILLDFMDLVTLSTLDRDFRKKFLQMCIDVEHAMQVRLLQELEENDAENGYQIVEEFLEETPHVKDNIKRNSRGVYTQSLFSKYFTIEEIEENGRTNREITAVDCPVWVLLELLTFGDLLKFFDFYRKKYPQPKSIPVNLLNLVRSLRNACAHNNCLLVSLSPNKRTKPPVEISKYVAHVLKISKDERSKRLANRPLLEITGLFYVYEQLVSEEAKERMKQEWLDLQEKEIEPSLLQLESNKMVTASLRYILNLIQHIY